MTTSLKLCLVLLVALVFMAVSPSWAESSGKKAQNTESKTVTQFAKVIDDLPLMPELTLQEDKDVLFATGKERIAQTTAAGSVDIDDVYQFYNHSLPQLGWKKIDARTYKRDKERLRIDVTGATPKAATIVRFSIEPVDKEP